MLKKALCLIFAFLLSINSFAAIVSDSDGSSFVTKAEFDNLKRSFADQIENYNNSIDSKIDGAISSYLAGLRLEKEEKLDCLLDVNGKYNNDFYIYWNGQSSSYRIGDSYHYALYDLFFSVWDWVVGTYPNYDNDEIWGGQFEGKNFYDLNRNSTLTPYNVAKLYKVKLTDTSTEYRLKYEKVSNHIKFNLFFQFPARNWNLKTRTGDVSEGELWNLLDINESRLTQNNLQNNLMTYFRRWNSSVPSVVGDVWKQCYATLTQNETATDHIIIFPFSTAREKVWDPEDTSSILDFRCEGNGFNALPRVGTPHGVPGYKDVKTTAVTSWGILSPKRINLPWQLLTDTVDLRDRKIQNLIDVDDKNSTAREGLILGHIPDYNNEMSLKVEGTCEAAGTVFIYVGDSAITNWEATEFKGKKVNVTANNKWKLEIDNVKKKEHVWLMFKNSSTTTVDSLVKIETFSIMI